MQQRCKTFGRCGLFHSVNLRHNDQYHVDPMNRTALWGSHYPKGLLSQLVRPKRLDPGSPRTTMADPVYFRNELARTNPYTHLKHGLL
jgi:hypothetical protein